MNDINWPAVFEAMKRCKYGRPQPGDQELCEHALKADKIRYAKEHARMREEVMGEMNPWRK